MGFLPVVCDACGRHYAPTRGSSHCEELITVLQQRNERLGIKVDLLRAIVMAHRRLVLGEVEGMTELDEAIRKAADDSGHPWATPEYSYNK